MDPILVILFVSGLFEAAMFGFIFLANAAMMAEENRQQIAEQAQGIQVSAGHH